MAKKIQAMVKLQIAAGKATPAPPVGTALGPHGVNIMDFCKNFNAKTAKDEGLIIPVVVTIYADRSLHLHHEDAAGVDPAEARRESREGIGRAEQDQGRHRHEKQVEDIAKLKMPDLNADTLESAIKTVAARRARWASTSSASEIQLTSAG